MYLHWYITDNTCMVNMELTVNGALEEDVIFAQVLQWWWVTIKNSFYMDGKLSKLFCIESGFGRYFAKMLQFIYLDIFSYIVVIAEMMHFCTAV